MKNSATPRSANRLPKSRCRTAKWNARFDQQFESRNQRSSSHRSRRQFGDSTSVLDNVSMIWRWAEIITLRGHRAATADADLQSLLAGPFAQRVVNLSQRPVHGDRVAEAFGRCRVDRFANQGHKVTRQAA